MSVDRQKAEDERIEELQALLDEGANEQVTVACSHILGTPDGHDPIYLIRVGRIKAEAHTAMGAQKDATSAVREVLARADALDDHGFLVTVLICMFDFERVKAAIAAMENAVVLAREMNDRATLDTVLYICADALCFNKRVKAAADRCHKALSSKEVRDIHALRIRALHSLGDVFKDEGEHKEASSAYVGAIVIAGQQNINDQVARIMLSFSEILMRLQRADDAVVMLEEAMTAARRNNDKETVNQVRAALERARRER